MGTAAVTLEQVGIYPAESRLDELAESKRRFVGVGTDHRPDPVASLEHFNRPCRRTGFLTSGRSWRDGRQRRKSCGCNARLGRYGRHGHNGCFVDSCRDPVRHPGIGIVPGAAPEEIGLVRMQHAGREWRDHGTLDDIIAVGFDIHQFYASPIVIKTNNKKRNQQKHFQIDEWPEG